MHSHVMSAGVSSTHRFCGNLVLHPPLIKCRHNLDNPKSRIITQEARILSRSLPRQGNSFLSRSKTPSSTVAFAGNTEGDGAVRKENNLIGSVFLRIAVAVLTLGFVDAGYSGDWSRIGALTLDQESQLRTAAFFVVPTSLSAIWALSRSKSEKA